MAQEPHIIMQRLTADRGQPNPDEARLIYALAVIRVPTSAPSQIRRIAPRAATLKTCLVRACSLASTRVRHLERGVTHLAFNPRASPIADCATRRGAA